MVTKNTKYLLAGAMTIILFLIAGWLAFGQHGLGIADTSTLNL